MMSNDWYAGNHVVCFSGTIGFKSGRHGRANGH